MKYRLEMEFEVEAEDRDSAAVLVNKVIDHCLLPFRDKGEVLGIRFCGYTTREKQKTKKK